MGRLKRERPVHFGRKLKYTRTVLNLPQTTISKVMFDDPTRRGHISEFERGIKEPSLPALVRLIKFLRRELKVKHLYVDHFIDDELELPF